jgi:hypothetical protein
MKTGLILLMSFFVIFTGCSGRAPDTTEAAGESARSHEAERDYFAESIDARLNAIEDDIDLLEQQASDLKGRARSEFDRSIASLRAQKDVVDKRLAELRKTNDASWASLKPSVNSAFQALQKSVNDFAAKHTPVR